MGETRHSRGKGRPAWFLLGILLLSGDVELNPGPKTRTADKGSYRYPIFNFTVYLTIDRIDTEQDWKLNTTMHVLSVFARKFWREIRIHS